MSSLLSQTVMPLPRDSMRASLDCAQLFRRSGLRLLLIRLPTSDAVLPSGLMPFFTCSRAVCACAV